MVVGHVCTSFNYPANNYWCLTELAIKINTHSRNLTLMDILVLNHSHKLFFSVFIKNVRVEVGEFAQLRVLGTCAEALGLIPSAQILTHNCL